MIESRQYRGLDLEIVKAKSSRVCYFLLPEGLKSDGLKFLEEAAEKYPCSMVVVSGFNWNDALTPWPAPGVFKEKNSKDPRMSTVESCTERVVEILRQQSVDVDYQLFHGTHFSPIVPRLEMALNSIMQQKI